MTVQHAGAAQIDGSGVITAGLTGASRLNPYQTDTREEGIIPALESSHAVAWVLDHAEELPQGGDVLVNLSGRGDKDLGIVKKYLNL